MYKYLKPPYPRYTAPYPVLYAEVPRRSRRRRDQLLYGARLVNSPYMYDDPYTTVAVNDPYAVPGSQNKEKDDVYTKGSTTNVAYSVILGFGAVLLKNYLSSNRR